MQDEAKIIKGETYIYAKKELVSQKIYKLSDTVVFLLDEDDDENDDWIHISLPRNRFSKSATDKINHRYDKFYISGFVKKSEIELIDNLKLIKDTSLELIFRIEKIDTSKIISKTNMSYGLEVPLNSNEVKELYLKWKGKLIKQDTALFDDLFNVTFKEELYSSVNNNKFSYYFKNGIYYIKQQCGDGAGFYEITWIIKNGKIIQRLIDEI